MLFIIILLKWGIMFNVFYENNFNDVYVSNQISKLILKVKRSDNNNNND